MHGKNGLSVVVTHHLQRGKFALPCRFRCHIICHLKIGFLMILRSDEVYFLGSYFSDSNVVASAEQFKIDAQSSVSQLSHIIL